MTDGADKFGGWTKASERSSVVAHFDCGALSRRRRSFAMALRQYAK
jgi:hypothetical protein